jgi:hypothetical protein
MTCMTETAHRPPPTPGTIARLVFLMIPIHVFLGVLWTVGLEGETLDRAQLWGKLGQAVGTAVITGLLLRWWYRGDAAAGGSPQRAR